MLPILVTTGTVGKDLQAHAMRAPQPGQHRCDRHNSSARVVGNPLLTLQRAASNEAGNGLVAGRGPAHVVGVAC